VTARASLLVAVVLSGCTSSLGTLGVVTPDATDVGLKLLTPGATGRSCRSSVLGVPLRAGEPDLREALGEILARDPEGDVVANADVRWRRLVTGIYNRRCVEVRGDLARTVSTIRLPAPPGHEGHGAR
jgi:hypothetical protein